MNVLGTVITSSPGPMPKARRASQSASVPLPTPTACGQSQYAAKSVSNPTTNGPPAKAPLSMTSWMAALISSNKGAWWDLRSRNGTFICILCCKFMQDPGGITCHCSIRRHVFRNDASSTDHGIFSDSYSTQQGRARTDCCPLLNHGTLAIPVHFSLKLPGGIDRPRIAIVDEGDTVPDEDPGLRS